MRNRLGGTSFSAADHVAVDIGRLIARQSAGLICLLHVLEPIPFLSALCTNPLLRSGRQVALGAMRQLKRVIDLLTDPRVTVGAVVRAGDTAREICPVAELLAADRIVLSQGRPAVFDRVFGRPLAEAVLRRAASAVLVLPAPEPGGDTCA